MFANINNLNLSKSSEVDCNYQPHSPGKKHKTKKNTGASKFNSLIGLRGCLRLITVKDHYYFLVF